MMFHNLLIVFHDVLLVVDGVLPRFTMYHKVFYNVLLCLTTFYDV